MKKWPTRRFFGNFGRRFFGNFGRRFFGHLGRKDLWKSDNWSFLDRKRKCWSVYVFITLKCYVTRCRFFNSLYHGGNRSYDPYFLRHWSMPSGRLQTFWSWTKGIEPSSSPPSCIDVERIGLNVHRLGPSNNIFVRKNVSYKSVPNWQIRVD
jgi:hypothetical protein